MKTKENTLCQGFCLSCSEGVEHGTGKPCRNGCTKEENKNPPQFLLKNQQKEKSA